MIYNVRDFGAVGDSHTIDTKSVQEAIDTVSKNGGGTLVFDEGVYVVSTIFIKSNITIELKKNAVITYDADFASYPVKRREARPILLFAEGEENITICGEGAVLGSGQADWGLWWGITDEIPYRLRTLIFNNCKNVTLTGVSFLYSDSWALHFYKCENLTIDSITIKNNMHHLNSDGIDPDACTHVRIRNCNITTGDDCIVAKTTVDGTVSDMVVENCVLRTPNTAIKLGTESHGDFRDITFKNCVIKDAAVGIGLFIKDGCTMEDITFKDIEVNTSDIEHIKPETPLFINVEKRHIDSPIGLVQNITYENIVCNTPTGALFQGMKDHDVKNLTFKNITMNITRNKSFDKRTKPVTGNRTVHDQEDTTFITKPAFMTFAYVDGVKMENVVINPPKGEECDKYAVCLCDAKNIELGNIEADGCKGRILE